jgi:hypothetical protein
MLYTLLAIDMERRFKDHAVHMDIGDDRSANVDDQLPVPGPIIRRHVKFARAPGW